MNKNSRFILAKGEKFYKIGKKILLAWIISWIMLLICVIAELIADGPESVVNALSLDFDWSVSVPFVAISYVGILVGTIGPVLYLNGLHLIGLGQIALNTDRE